MVLDLADLKTYLRIDGSEDDVILALMVDAGKEYLTDAGVPEQESARYKLALMLYCAMHYENRDPTTKVDRFNVSFESIIQQLKASGGEIT